MSGSPQASASAGTTGSGMRSAGSTASGLRFEPGIDPVAQLEDLRQRFRIPHGRLICRPFAAKERRTSITDPDRRRVLKQALMLGLCTAQLYDPARPVLWTTASLSRGLVLFEPEGFYA